MDDLIEVRVIIGDAKWTCRTIVGPEFPLEARLSALRNANDQVMDEALKHLVAKT